MCAVCPSVSPLCNLKWLCSTLRTSLCRHWFPGLNCKSPVTARNSGLCDHLRSVSLWKVREPEKREEGRPLCDYHTGITKESGKIVLVGLKTEPTVESLGCVGLFCFLKNKLFLRPNEKELDSSVSEPFKAGGRIWWAPLDRLILIEHLLSAEQPQAALRQLSAS